MRRGRPKVELLLTDEERAQLQSFARSRSLPAALSTRARIVLSSADGELNSAIAARLKLTKATVGKWRTRFIERRIPRLYDDVRPGKPRTIDDERVAQLIKTTLHTKPANGSTHWSVRTVAAETGISTTSLQRYFLLFGLQPHRTESFRLSNDPFFVSVRPTHLERSEAGNQDAAGVVYASAQLTLTAAVRSTARVPSP